MRTLLFSLLLFSLLSNALGCRGLPPRVARLPVSTQPQTPQKIAIKESDSKESDSKESDYKIALVGHSESKAEPSQMVTANQMVTAHEPASTATETVRAHSPVVDTSNRYPIDFPTVLRLAGADNWSIKIAQQRVLEANAKYCAAKSAWLPSLTVSLGFNNHEGQIQATEGDIVTVSRSSLFLGAGAGIANAPLNGGSGGPPRMFVDFSLADAIFKPLAARRMVGAEEARQNRVINDTMLEASLAYYELVGAQSQLAITQTNLAEAQELASLTEAFVEAGKGTPADASRIAVVVNNRLNGLAMAESNMKIASARLVTILQLDPTKLNPQFGLIAMEGEPVPLGFVPESFDLNSTIQQAQSMRCEIAEANARAHSAAAEFQAEQWRPWLPNMYLGYSGGLFGGGPGGGVAGLEGRSDLDVVVSWQVKNLGFGSRALQDAGRSKTYQRNFEAQQIRDQIAEQVTTAYQRVEQFRSMVGTLSDSIQHAGDGLEKNLAAIEGLEGMPLESLSSLEQLAIARKDYATTVTNFNQWQIRLLRSAGQSLAPDAALGQFMPCNACSDGCDGANPSCSNCIQRPSRQKKSVTGSAAKGSSCAACETGTCHVDATDCGLIQANALPYESQVDEFQTDRALYSKSAPQSAWFEPATSSR